MARWSLMSPSDATFFVDPNSDRNLKKYRALLEDQYRIAYLSQGAFNFHEVGCLTTEDKEAIIEVIKSIKKQEEQQVKRATSQSPQNVAPSPLSKPQSYSSKSFVSSKSRK